MAVAFSNTAQSIAQFEDYLFRGYFCSPFDTSLPVGAPLVGAQIKPMSILR